MELVLYARAPNKYDKRVSLIVYDVLPYEPRTRKQYGVRHES